MILRKALIALFLIYGGISMLKGKALNTSSTIGIISPASCEDKSIINEKINTFRTLTGYKIKIAPHVYDKYGYLAGSDKCRAMDLNNMFADKSIDGIVCLRGGYGSIRMMKYIDKKLIKKNPKFFCGFSDITLLLNYFSKLGLITFHGPMIKSNFNDEETLNSFLDISSCCSKNYIYNLNDMNQISYINKKSFEGKICGGNLVMMCSSLGTPFEVDTKNSILLIEEINEAPYAIDRMLTQLIYAKKLKSCHGIILGNFTDCALNDYSKSFNIEEIINDRLKPLNIPIIVNMPIGHSYPNITLPIGCKAKFSCQNNSLTILDNFLS